MQVSMCVRAGLHSANYHEYQGNPKCRKTKLALVRSDSLISLPAFLQSTSPLSGEEGRQALEKTVHSKHLSAWLAPL